MAKKFTALDLRFTVQNVMTTEQQMAKLHPKRKASIKASGNCLCPDTQ